MRDEGSDNSRGTPCGRKLSALRRRGHTNASPAIPTQKSPRSSLARAPTSIQNALHLSRAVYVSASILLRMHELPVDLHLQIPRRLRRTLTSNVRVRINRENRVAYRDEFRFVTSRTTVQHAHDDRAQIHCSFLPRLLLWCGGFGFDIHICAS